MEIFYIIVKDIVFYLCFSCIILIATYWPNSSERFCLTSSLVVQVMYLMQGPRPWAWHQAQALISIISHLSLMSRPVVNIIAWQKRLDIRSRSFVSRKSPWDLHLMSSLGDFLDLKDLSLTSRYKYCVWHQAMIFDTKRIILTSCACLTSSK